MPPIAAAPPDLLRKRRWVRLAARREFRFAGGRSRCDRPRDTIVGEFVGPVEDPVARDGKRPGSRSTGEVRRAFMTRRNGQVEGREVGHVAYMLANSEGKSRAKRDGSGRPAARWRTLLLSSGEQSLADKMAEADRTMHAARKLDLSTSSPIPATEWVSLKH